MSSYDLAQKTGAPASTIYKIVDELVERSMLTRTGENSVWLGPRLMRYGLTYRSHMNVFNEAKREMEALAERLGETIQICARDEDMMTVIGMSRGEDHFNVASDVGTRVPLNWTASGRLLLGHLDEHERVRIFRQIARPSTTGKAETDRVRLAELSGRRVPRAAGRPDERLGIRRCLHRRAHLRRDRGLRGDHLDRAAGD